MTRTPYATTVALAQKMWAWTNRESCQQTTKEFTPLLMQERGRHLACSWGRGPWPCINVDSETGDPNVRTG